MRSKRPATPAQFCRGAHRSFAVLLPQSLAVRTPAGPPHDAPRRGAGVLPIPEHLAAVDKDVDHARGVLVRIVEGGVVLDGAGSKTTTSAW